jgi:hypothetical protein
VPFGKDHDRPEAEPESQEITQRDRPVRRHRIVERAVDPAQDPALRQFRQPFVDWIIEPQPALLDQDHGCGRGDRFGQRGDTEDGVAAHRCVAAECEPADRIDMHLAAAVDQGHEARHMAALDMAGHDLVHVAAPRAGQFPGAHHLFPRCPRIRPGWRHWPWFWRPRGRNGGFDQRRGGRRGLNTVRRSRTEAFGPGWDAATDLPPQALAAAPAPRICGFRSIGNSAK